MTASWTLLILISLHTGVHGERNMVLTTMPGFSTKFACEQAAHRLDLPGVTTITRCIEVQ